MADDPNDCASTKPRPHTLFPYCQPNTEVINPEALRLHFNANRRVPPELPDLFPSHSLVAALQVNGVPMPTSSDFEPKLDRCKQTCSWAPLDSRMRRIIMSLSRNETTITTNIALDQKCQQRWVKC